MMLILEMDEDGFIKEFGSNYSPTDQIEDDSERS